MYIFNDSFLSIVFFAISNTWYSMDHDEYLKPYHYYHHKYINSNYCVYINLPYHDPNDKVKDVVKRS